MCAAAPAQRQELRPGAAAASAAAEQAAQILALLERDRAAVDLGDVADDGEAEAGAGLAGVEPGAAVEDRWRARPRGCRVPSSSTSISTHSGVALDGDEDAAAAIFGGILDQIAEHLVEILPLDPRPPACLSPARSTVTFS